MSTSSNTATWDVIIDCDPGVDDAMAILLALASPKLNVVSLTIVHGNLPCTVQLARNARTLLAVAGRHHIPVIRGEEKPLLRPQHAGSAFVHGEDGLGDAGYAGYSQEVGPSGAAEHLVEEALKERRRPLRIICLGPLTNVAKAYQLDNRIAGLLHLHVMGGNFMVPGNVTPMAEANVWNDPEAADLIFSHFDVTLVPLDVTTQVHFDAAYLQRLTSRAPILGPLLEKIASNYIAFCALQEGSLGLAQAPFHDGSAVMSLLHPELFPQQEMHWVRIECSDSPCRGVCVADFRGGKVFLSEQPRQNVRVMLAVNAEAFLKRYSDAVADLDSSLAASKPS